MPKFSANLGFLWPDRPLLDRIDAAAKAGFKAIELHWPYATPTMAAIWCCRRVSSLPRLLSHLAIARKWEAGHGAEPLNFIYVARFPVPRRRACPT
jgi:hydroxypyruvate isomerase